jgi:hypothetical protein
MRVKSLDVVILAACAAGILFSAARVYGSASSEPSVSISGKGGEWIYPLKQDRKVEVEGPGGTARVEDSPCPNKTCVAAGAISRPGQWVACLPNAVMVRIDGSGGKASVDAGTY